ncbi:MULTISPECIES: PadR family transcriptional regulator [Bacillus]|uniref:PadR family transcriptional regulator n=1 Tax=Bacillus TaxID=1386 RepID=UPI000BB962F9|nr:MULTISPECIES: PadR family transcriptional regulator [Bacillus]
MKDPFFNLKSTMKKTVFKDFSLSDERKHAIKESVQSKQLTSIQPIWKEETIVKLLASLQNEEKHGYEICTYLFQRDERCFHNNEGQLYTLLHLLENKQLLSSSWQDEKKYYTLTSKGKKQLALATKDGAKKQWSFKHLLEEASYELD